MDDTPLPSPPLASQIKEKLLRMWRLLLAGLFSWRFELVLLTLVATFFLFPFVYHTIPAGHVAVLWKRFEGGTVTDRVYPEGYILTLPWDTLYIYDIRLQKVENQVNVLSSDGLQIVLTLVWRFRLIPESVPDLHKFIGPNYSESMITPTVGALARDVIAVYQPEEVYTERRLKIQRQILESVRHELHEGFSPVGRKKDLLIFEDVLIKEMVLPKGVQEAIVRKNSMFHEMEEYTFRVEREHKEAERKRIEAAGIRQFQEIVSIGMSDSYLRWRGIEATLELAKSPNAKVVVIGNNKNGLPLILNAGKEGVETLPETGHSAAKKP